METAKATVQKFIGKSGKHDTTVHEHVAPAVQHENVTRTEHENVMPVVNREVHQDHYHTTVQPIKHGETLPEQHHHKAAAVEHRSFEHGNKEDVERRLAEERAQFTHEKQHVDGHHTSTTAPVVVGEQKHHHVHEMIQPVVQKETIEPHVVHHTVPVHETHHNDAHHHSGTTLPAMTMDEFSKLGGSLKGREEHVERYAGEPQMQHGITGAGSHHNTHTGNHSTHDGLTSARDGHNTTHDGLTSARDGHNSTHDGLRSTRDGLNTTHDGRHTNSTTNNNGNFGEIRDGKPSLVDKINPRKDADGDGKPGFMK